jgi:hypothetical protein
LEPFHHIWSMVNHLVHWCKIINLGFSWCKLLNNVINFIYYSWDSEVSVRLTESKTKGGLVHAMRSNGPHLQVITGMVSNKVEFNGRLLVEYTSGPCCQLHFSNSLFNHYHLACYHWHLVYQQTFQPVPVDDLWFARCDIVSWVNLPLVSRTTLTTCLLYPFFVW